MITKEDWEIILEREGLDSFLHAVESAKVDQEFEIFETNNNYYGVIYKIFAYPYPGEEMVKKISAFLTAGMPIGSVVHFFRYVSNNIENLKKRRKNLFKNINEDGLNNGKMLSIMEMFQEKFMEEKTKKSLIKNYNYYINNQEVYITVMIPTKKQNGDRMTKDDIVLLFAKIQAVLRDYIPQSISKEEYVQIMKELLNINEHVVLNRDDISPIHDQIMDNETSVKLKDNGTIVFGKIKKFTGQVPEEESIGLLGKMFGKKKKDKTIFEGEKYCKILSKKQYPYYVSISQQADAITNFFGKGDFTPLLPTNSFISLVVKIEDPEKAKHKLEEDAKWNKFQLSGSGKMAEYSPYLTKRVEESDIAIQMLDKGQIPMKAMWSCGIFASNENQLEKITSTFKNKLKTALNFDIQEEYFLSLPVLLYSLPLQYDNVFFNMSQKFSTLYYANVSSLVPLYTDSKGFGEPVLNFIGKNGQLQGVDFFSSHVSAKHFVIVAPSGKGKTVLTQEIIRNYLSLNTLIRVIDREVGYKKICDLVGGEFISFGENDCFNFLDEVSTDSNGNLRQEDIEAFSEIILKMTNIDADIEENDNAIISGKKSKLGAYIKEAVQQAFKMGGEKIGEPAGMQEVLKALEYIYKGQQEKAMDNTETEVDPDLRDLIISLREYGNKKGSKYRYFNGKATLKFSKKFVAFSIMPLEKLGETFKSLIVMILINKINKEFFYEDRNRKKMIIVDEAWDLMRDKKVAKFFNSSARTGRKFNAVLGIVTNSIMDVIDDSGVKIVFENSGYQIYFEQNISTIRQAKNSGTLPMDNFQFELISSLKNEQGIFSEIMIVTDSGMITIGRFFMCSVLFWLYASQPDETTFIKQVATTFEIEENVAAIAIGIANNDYSEDKLIKSVQQAKALINSYTHITKDNEKEKIYEDIEKIIESV